MRSVVSLLLLSLACAPSPDEAVVARVNGEKIRTGDLQAVLQEEAADYGPEILGRPDGRMAVKNKLLTDLVERRLLLQEAKTLGVSLSPEEKRTAFEKLKSGYSEEEFLQELKKTGRVLARWQESQEQKLIVAKLIDQILIPEKPSDREVETEYRRNRSSWREPDRVHCRQIVTSSRAKAEKILSLLKKGGNFAALAQQYSESPDRENGGDLGWVAHGELPTIMDEACFRYGTGDTSGIVASDYGFHIFRVIEKKPARSLTLKEARPLIEKDWLERHRDEILGRWLDEKYKRAKIEIDEKRLESIPIPAL